MRYKVISMFAFEGGYISPGQSFESDDVALGARLVKAQCLVEIVEPKPVKQSKPKAVEQVKEES